MAELIRHCQTKGAETDRLNLNYYANFLLYPNTRNFLPLTPRDSGYCHSLFQSFLKDTPLVCLYNRNAKTHW